MSTRPVRRVAVVAVLVAVVITSAAALASAPTRAPQQTTGVREYVALGDSYTSGPLIPRSLSAFGCLRSTRNYPSLVARRLGVGTFLDVSCSGATTRDVAGPRPAGRVAPRPQVAWVSRSTDLVTVGVGGNDFGLFTRLVGVCPRLRAGDPAGAPCRERFRATGRDRLLRKVARTGERVEALLVRVGRRAPRATVLVVGYPRIVPPAGTCPRVLPLAAGDYRYVDRVQRRLNAALWRAAVRTGAGFVDTYAASRGHDACAGERAWVNGRRTDPSRALAYHPYRAYMRAVAGLVVDRVRRQPP